MFYKTANSLLLLTYNTLLLGYEHNYYILNSLRCDNGVYYITAKNELGNKTCKVSVEVFDVPGLPKNITPTKIMSDFIIIIWAAPDDNGGAALMNYVVEKREGKNNKKWTAVTNSISEAKYRYKNT